LRECKAIYSSFEELTQPQLDNTLHYKFLSDLFSEWLKQQIEQFEVEIDLKSKGSKPTPKYLKAEVVESRS
jgi:hypothetical protein